MSILDPMMVLIDALIDLILDVVAGGDPRRS
jgi:hypothetical protein